MSTASTPTTPIQRKKETVRAPCFLREERGAADAGKALRSMRQGIRRRATYQRQAGLRTGASPCSYLVLKCNESTEPMLFKRRKTCLLNGNKRECARLSFS